MSFVDVLAQPFTKQPLGEIEESQWHDGSSCGVSDNGSCQEIIPAIHIDPYTDQGEVAMMDAEEERLERLELSKKQLDAERRAKRAKMVEGLAMERKKFISPMFKVNSLFTEAANWEIQKIKKDGCICDAERKLLIQDVRRAYKSLVTDVEDVIRARLPTGVKKEETITEENMNADYRYEHRKPEELKAALMTIAEEAISFHSTMLPFSDGILSKEQLPIAQETMLKGRRWIEEGVSGGSSFDDELDSEEDGWFNYITHRAQGRGKNTVILSIAASTPLSQAKKSKVLAKRSDVLERVRHSGQLFI